MNNPKLYTVKEAAGIVGVSTNTLYKYLDEDRIHAARGSAIQGRFRIPESALEEFLGIKLSEPVAEIVQPITDPYTPGVKGAHTPGLSDDTDPLTDRITESPISPAPVRTGIPVKVARVLLIFALLAILIDLVISQSVSPASQLARLFFVAVMILLSYQEGGFRRS